MARLLLMVFNYMTQLNKFTFSINTEVYNDIVRVKLPSNENVQRSFIGRGYQKITFPYLIFIDLKCAHVDYAELFLVKKKYASTSFVKSLDRIQITHNDNKQFYQ